MHLGADMYKFASKQMKFSDFNQPLGLSMNPNNRWIKKAEISSKNKDDNQSDSPKNSGTLLVDATCAPSQIKFPKDRNF